MLASAHRDVLEAAIPETVEGQAKLVEELKNRARAAVGYKSWKDACGKSSENANQRFDRRTRLLTTTNKDKLAGNSKY